MSGVEAVNKTLLGEVRESGDSVITQWPTRWFLPIGGGIMALAVALQIIRDIRKARGGGED
jgi:TRAP-type C4-dicarboxylate transport system permease small subunit